MTTLTPIATGLSGVIGSDYNRNNDQLVFVEFGGNLSSINAVRSSPSYTVLGTGYAQPEDVVLSADGTFAYVTERVGNLLQVDLSSPNRASATVISSGMTAPHQLVLDEVNGYAYVVEFANPGRLLRIDLASGTQTTLLNNLQFAIGLLMTSNFSAAYITEQMSTGTGRLSRFDLSSSHGQVLVTSTTAPLFFMTWANAGESAIIVTERDPANQVWVVDLGVSPNTLNPLTTSPVPVRPSSVAFVGPSTLVVCCNDEIDLFDPTDGFFNPGGPILIGIGQVPKTQIVGGIANTSAPYLLVVTDAVFGATISVMVNHDFAFSVGAVYYTVRVDGIPQQTSLSDYLSVGGTFVLQTVNPVSLGGSPPIYYPVRNPSDIWDNHWLGCRVDTTALSNGSHNIQVDLYSWGAFSLLGSDNVDVIVENRSPVVAIDTIEQNDNLVGTCAIVYVDNEATDDNFTFDIIALHPGGYMRAWDLVALWGDNQSKDVDNDNYGNNLAGRPFWNGYATDTTVPAVTSTLPWQASTADPDSTNCAHTFFLSAWDRVIDGYVYVHSVSVHKSITITHH